ncbi:flagellar biosynthesis protein FliW [Campylobacter sp. MIT 99-7217]|uniref:flagellar assembly protein FliW n=1 Tax=Campylobacter sp. MIT 99-7217 TaxID=535091 RepID=UPI00115C134B|nr:flagellar assembly protein FliW [Campylobacter sp. MIT 99-7217]TQR34550.1 flagellar biosynthesis protein FliW [Campylobacter sp. MIT 99-7217]
MKLSVKCPILGFEDTKNMELEPIDEIFFRLHSLDGQDFDFVLIDPTLLRTDYEFEVATYYQELLNLNENTKYQVYVIVALNKTVEDSCVNFLAPIVVNLDNNSMVQVILDSVNYPDFFQADKISNYFHHK